jgi:TetR/AcrR family transcriptional repressor of nem operon
MRTNAETGRRRPKAPPSRSTATVDRILDVAESLVQTVGYNGFSYADVAAQIGISKPSLHHHFRTKELLGVALIERYARKFGAALQAIDADRLSAPQRLARYAQLYAGVLAQDRLCLCGMLAAEYRTLPMAMQKLVRTFLADNECWLTGVIAAGRAAGELAPRGADREAALLVLGGLEGALLIARPGHDLAGFASMAEQLFAGLIASH